MKWKYKAIVANAGNVFLRRLSFYLKKGSIKIHLITGDDSDVFHTHPWDFTSFILFGGYREFVRLSKSEKFGYAYGSNRNNYLLLYKPHEIDLLNITLKRDFRMFSINKKLHTQQHRVELFQLFGFKIPAITLGIYSEKLELCSFCKAAGRCLSNEKK